MNRVPAVVVTLPARTVADARKQVAEARRSGADLAEVRCDRLTPAERGRLEALFPSELPLVATLRSRAEGGEGPDAPEERRTWLSEIARLPFREIDIESARDLPVAASLAPREGRGLIVSSHRLQPVPTTEWARLLREPVPEGATRKVVVPAGIGQLVSEMLPALPPPGETALVAHTVGSSGPLLRAWAGRFGLSMVFASLPADAAGEPRSVVEPSQIPVDRLRAYLDAGGIAPIFAVAGHPVAHSRSPSLHARWMRENRRSGLYLALDFEDESEFVESLPFLVDGGFRGLNVTHPFKHAALEVADRVGSGALACGVANTLSFDREEVEAENTDLAAVLRRFEELRADSTWDGRSVGVIGAGGAARATLAAARSMGVEAWVWARRPEIAENLAREFGAHASSSSGPERPTLVVNATPLGREGAEGPFPGAPWLTSGGHLLDWVYDPATPVARKEAERVGASYEDGSRLLVYQAAASFGIWWGDEPSADQLAAVLGGEP